MYFALNFREGGEGRASQTNKGKNKKKEAI
jgi:hypothetical protein